jgi:hypothetical protein
MVKNWGFEWSPFFFFPFFFTFFSDVFFFPFFFQVFHPRCFFLAP